jgi:amino acid transporter
MSGLSSFASLITLIVYFMVVLCTLWLTKQKKIKCKFWEIIGYFIAEALVIVVLVYHFYDLINGVVTSTTNWINKVGKDPLSDFIKAITKISIELFSLVLVFSLFFINYFTYYKRKLLSRTKAQQKKLDAPFRLLTLSEQKRLD